MEKKATLYVFRLSSIITFVLTALMIQAQTFTFNDTWYENGFNLKSENRSGITVGYSVGEFTLVDTDVNGETMKTVLLKDHFLFNDEGAPNLPGKGRYIAIPEGATPVLNIVNSRTEHYYNIEIAPAPRIPLETEDGPLQMVRNNDIYGVDAFYPAEPVKISEVSQIRGVDVVILGITPFQYNPVTRELIVYRDIEVEITLEGGTGQYGEERFRNSFWDPVIKDALLNPKSLPVIDYSKRVFNQNRANGCEYLIIVPDGPEFMTWAETIRQHRIEQGITTEIVTLSEIGGNTAPIIEGYINDIYANWDPVPAAVLLLADYGTNMTNSITSPIWDNYCVSDNIYADVDNDDMPDIIFARITANNEDQLEVMVTKFLNYELNPPIAADFYDHPITALGYQTERWFQICSESVAGYFEVVQGKSPVRINAVYSGNPQTGPWSTAQNTQMVLDVFGPNGLGYIPASPGQVNCTWNGTANDVSNAINDGSFILQHRDHGSESGWGEPAFQSGNINNLVNTDLTFVFSINCLTGKYNWNQECFTEKFHRHTASGQNSGALGLIAASEVSYSFVNDTYVWGMFDNMWPDFMPQFESEVEERGMLPAFGNAAGKYFLQQSNWPYNTSNKEVTYNLFHHHGDAFLELYSEVPQDLDVLHDGIILAGLNQITIATDDDAKICLTVGDQIIGMGTGTSSPEAINIIPQPVGTMVKLTITKPNHFRHVEQIEVIPPDGAYCIYEGHIIHDPDGNGNGQPDFEEFINLSMTVKNVGLENGEDIMVTLSTTDPYIQFVDDSEMYGMIVQGGSKTIEDAFRFFINDAVPDQHKIFFTVTASNGEDSWESLFSIRANAPDIHINHMVIDDSEYGNGDGELDPGETVTMTVQYSNTGHAKAYNVNSYLEGQSGFVEVLNPNQMIPVIGFFTQPQKTFEVIVDDDAPEGMVVKFVNELTMNAFYMPKIFPCKISAMCEDFETGDFSKYNWQHGGNANWDVSLDFPYDGFWSARAGEISGNQTSELSIDYKVMTSDSIVFTRKVSSDPGDKLEFYIGSYKMGEWTGTSAGWRRTSFPVGAGNRTFKWVYTKDGSGTAGADCAWLDNIIFPPPMLFTIWAGPDTKVCEGSDYSIEDAYGTVYETAEWTTNGTGTFDDATVIHATYTPSNQDIANGEVTLTLTLWNDEGEMLTDETILGFKTAPGPPPTAQGPDWVDLLVTTTSDYTTEGLDGISEYHWYLLPEEAGTIEGTGTSAIVTWNPEYLGIANVSLAGINECGEGVKSENFEVTVDNTVGTGNLVNNGQEVVIAPNPSSGIFYLYIPDRHDQKVNVRIFSLLGKELYQEKIHMDGELRKSINLSSWPNGIYFLVLESQDNVVSKKIIKK